MKRLILIIGLIIVLPFWVWVGSQAFGATYYVDDTCGTPGDGTSDTCAGAGTDPWKDLDDITGVVAGDFVYFKRGGIWRPADNWGAATYGLNPGSGSIGSLKTYGAYGEGDDPIITAADLLESWTNVPGDTYLSLSREVGDSASTPDAAALKILGDLDLRIKLSMADWFPSSGDNEALIAKGNIEYLFRIDPAATAKITFFWMNAVDTQYSKSVDFEQLGWTSNSIHWLRVTFDVDNGAGDAEIKFYWSDNGTDWTQFGATQYAGTTTDIRTCVTPLYVGHKGAAADPLGGHVYQAQVYDGIGGTLVFDADFSAEVAGTTSFTESSEQAATVTINQTGDPIAEIVTDTTDVWYTVLATDPNMVWFDGVAYPEAASAILVDATDRWYWDNGETILYVYATSSPELAYTSPGVEAPSKITSFLLYDSDYVRIENLHFKYATMATGAIQGDSDNNEISGCTFTGSSGYPGTGYNFQIQGTSDDNTIEDSTFTNNNYHLANDTVSLFCDGADCPTSNTIQNCVIKNGGHTTLHLINVSNNIIQDNEIYTDATDGTTYGRCLDVEGTVTSGANIFRRNYIHNSYDGVYSGCGNQINGAANEFYNNIVAFGNSYGLKISDYNDVIEYRAVNNLFYNNVIYGHDKQGIYNNCNLAESGGNIFKNNIIAENGSDESNQQVFILNDADAEDIDMMYNLIFSSSTSDTVYYNDAARTVAYMETNVSGDWSNNVVSDPLFTNAAGGDFTLQVGSPCINTGVIPAGFEAIFPLDPNDTVMSPWAPVVAPSDFGGLREIGAFAFFRRIPVFQNLRLRN